MKEKLRDNIFLILLILPAFTIYGCGENRKDDTQNSRKETYYCPMDTEIVSKKPGICPKCKMDLIKKADHSGHIHNHKKAYYCPMCPGQEQDKPGICKVCNMDLVVKTNSPEANKPNSDTLYVNDVVLSKVKTINPVEKTLPVKISAKGYISYDTRRIYSVSSRFEGRIEKLYVKYAFQPIKKGQPMFDIYSHDLRSAQHNYILILNSGSDSPDLINAAKEKLSLLGMTDAQIKHLETTGHVKNTTTVYSAYDGYIVEKTPDGNSSMPTSSRNMSGDPEMASVNKTEIAKENDLLTREGTYVKKGEEVFKVVNTDIVWGILEVYTEDIGSIKPNLPVTIKMESTGRSISGKINLIEPNYGNGSQTLKLRIYLDNKDHVLRIGNLISATIDAGEKKGLWIPRTAVIDLGNEKAVFIKNKDVYITRKIVAGIMRGEEIEIVNGLTSQDGIAENAQFLIDSESFVKLNQ